MDGASPTDAKARATELVFRTARKRSLEHLLDTPFDLLLLARTGLSERTGSRADLCREFVRLTVPQALVGRWPLRVEHQTSERPLEEQLAALTRVRTRDFVGFALFAYDEGATESRARALVRDAVLLHEQSPTRRRIIDGLLAECEAIASMQRRLERARASLGAARR